MWIGGFRHKKKPPDDYPFYKTASIGMGSAAVLQNPQLVVFLGTIVQLVGLAGDDAMANLSQIIAEIPVIGTGDGQSLAVLLGIHGHKEVDIVRCRLILLAQHGGDNRLQSLEQIGLCSRGSLPMSNSRAISLMA